MAKGLFAVMEDEFTSEITGVTPEQAEQAEQVERLEGEVAEGEVVQAENEVAEANETVDQAVAAIEELTEISDVMADSVAPTDDAGVPTGETGEGLTGAAAQIAKVAVEAICARLGYKPAKKQIPALESFGSTSSRLEATKFAMENIGETIKKIWEAIKGFFKTIWEKIKGFWTRFFTAAGRLKARAEKVEKRVTEAEDKDLVVDSEKKIDVAKYCVAFEVKSADQVLKSAEQLVNTHTAIVNSLNKTAEGSEKLLKDITSADTTDKINKLAERYTSLVIDNGYQFNVVKAEGDAQILSGLGFNNRVKAVLSAENASISMFTVDAKVEKAETVGTAAKDLKVLTINIKKYADDLIKAKTAVAKTEQFIKTAIAAADKLSKSNENPELAKEQAKGFRFIQACNSLVTTKYTAIGIQVGAAALSYVEANLGTLKAA